MSKLQVVKYEHNFLLLLAEEYKGQMTWNELSIKLFDKGTQYDSLFKDTVKELGIDPSETIDYSDVYVKAIDYAPETQLMENEDGIKYLKVDEEVYAVDKVKRTQTILNKVGLKLL